MKDFEDSEKVSVQMNVVASSIYRPHSTLQVHVMMLVAEAKFQSSLLYAMRAVSEYYNTS